MAEAATAGREAEGAGDEPKPPDAMASLAGEEGLLMFDVGVEDPRALRAFSIARCCWDNATDISSLVSISVSRVSSSGAGLVEWI